MIVSGDLSARLFEQNMNFDHDMAPARYLNFLAAEGAYVDLYSSSLERAFHLLRLLARVMRQRRRYKNRVFSRMTWYDFCRLCLRFESTKNDLLATSTSATRYSSHGKRKSDGMTRLLPRPECNPFL